MSRQMILLGTGTSNGVPVIGCRCPVCTSTDPRNHRTRTGVVIEAPEGNLLIDASPELRLQLIREQIALVHAVLFTHSHADHIFGVDDLRLCQYRLNRPLTLYCEADVELRLRQAFDYAFKEPDPNAHVLAAPHFKIERIGLEPFELLGQPIRPIRLMHGKLPVLGFRVNDVAFCTDVSFIPDESWPLLEGLDTLILDALQDSSHPTHFNIEQALQVVDRVKPRQTYFTHVSHKLEHAGTNHRLPPGVALAYDGLRIPL